MLINHIKGNLEFWGSTMPLFMDITVRVSSTMSLSSTRSKEHSTGVICIECLLSFTLVSQDILPNHKEQSY